MMEETSPSSTKGLMEHLFYRPCKIVLCPTGKEAEARVENALALVKDSQTSFAPRTTKYLLSSECNGPLGT